MIWVYILVPIAMGIFAGILFATDANTRRVLNMKLDERTRAELCLPEGATFREVRNLNGWFKYTAPDFCFGALAATALGAIILDPIIWLLVSLTVY